jgi:mRNA interferase MazF
MEQILKRKDIILVPFPFSDLSSQKRRPAVIMSKDGFNEESPDVLVCAITSNISDADTSVLIKPEDWKDGLYSESCVKVATIMSIEKTMAVKKIGRLGTERFNEVKRKVIALFE